MLTPPICSNWRRLIDECGFVGVRLDREDDVFMGKPAFSQLDDSS
jgi:hypothetical protein